MNHDILSQHKVRSVTGIEIELSDMLMRSPMLDRLREREREARRATMQETEGASEINQGSSKGPDAFSSRDLLVRIIGFKKVALHVEIKR